MSTSKKTAAKRTAKTTTAPAYPFAPRVIPILDGDVFGNGSSSDYDFVVVGAGPDACEIRRTRDGKRGRIQTVRINNEYHRVGAVAQKRAHKRLAAIMAKEAKGSK